MAGITDFIGGKLIGLGNRLSSRLGDPAYLIREASAEDVQLMRTASRYSMTKPTAQWAFIQALRDTHRRGLKGAIVECGVWKGGNLIIAGSMGKRVGDDRMIWGFDTFTGMSAPTEHDVKPDKKTLDATAKVKSLTKGGITDWCYAPIDEVRDNFAKEACGELRLVKGMVEDTLADPANIPEKISVLRLDTDFYESTKMELECLYPRLESGGVLIIDDYGSWAGARKAVDEYFGASIPWLHYIDHDVRLVVKG